MTAHPVRSRRLTSTVRFRVTALAALVALAVLATGSVALVVTQRQLLTRSLDDGLRQRADDLTGLVVADRLPLRPGAIEDDTAAQVVGTDGKVVAASPNLARQTTPLAEEPPAAGPDETVRTVDELSVDDDRFRLLSRRVDTPSGTFVIHVAGSLGDIGESTGLLATSLTVAAPACAALVALLVWWLVGRALRPVEAIRAEVADISGSDLHRRVPEPASGDEIGRLARTMNGMLDRVEAAAERQRRFVADASHELRGPLTRIRAEVEVDLAHPGTADPAATHRSVLEEVTGLQRLVADLLVLARSDAIRPPVPDAVVDLDELVLEQAREAGAGSDAGVEVDTTGVATARVNGDRGELGRAVANLLDNAVRHAAATVTVTLDQCDGTARLTVTDDGPGIPAGERGRVFERFARLDDARTGSDGGTGLGLAIARDIARRHGGDITIVDGVGAGARFVLTAPATDQAGGAGPFGVS